ncbi:non-specific serine/threonine protein kinase [Salvia divinorum]|uniref:Non-specific serine/threonine protein kinase n=1 Tax=Salvia divinorum TaxID=28513 RepID=A0ABD1FZX3_SALDI
MLRYSNATFYGNMDTSPMWLWWNPYNTTYPDQFEEVLSRLLDRLREQAADGGSLRKVAAGTESGPAFQDIFALQQCTPDLTKEECSNCLINAKSNIPANCDGKRGCRVISPSCTLRFEIAVKRLSKDSGQGKEKLLIYELVQNASLDHFIFDKRCPLDWERRYKIIGGIPRGILYLHEDSRLKIIHRDLKPSNILLDTEMNPKIADFGTARLFGQDETQGNTSRIVGTYGYMPPEYMIHGQFSIKSDVFSFGVLVLEIISGCKRNNFRSGDVEDLLSFAWKNWREGTAASVVDPGLRSGSGSMSEMLRCMHIGLLCVQEKAAERPTMASVVIMLSSASISLAVPSEPAFYSSGGYTPRRSNYNSRELESINTRQSPASAADQSDHSSNNEVSITDLHPR